MFPYILSPVTLVTVLSVLKTGGSQRGIHGRTSQLENVTDIIRSILDGYDIRLRPQFGGEPLALGMDIAIASFDSISEVNMDYTLTLYLNQYWADERLAFAKDKDYDLTLSGDFAERIWVPDTFFANDKNSFLHEVTEKNKMVRLKSNGSIAYGMRFTTTLACMMDLHYYPLDYQNCTVEIESYGYTVDDVKMHWTSTPVVGVEEADLPQFSIIRWETTDRIEKLATGMYQRLSLSFELKRNIGYFIFQTYLPSILIVMLSWVSFWINHEATSARVALGITTVLTMTTISTGVRSSLPRISYVKAIDIYLVMSFVFVFAALLEYAAVNYTYWGARAKKKNKRSSTVDINKPSRTVLQSSITSTGHMATDGSVVNAMTQQLGGGLSTAVGLPKSSNEEAIELHEIQSSPIAMLRNRKNASLNQALSEPELRFASSSSKANNANRFYGSTGRGMYYGSTGRTRFGRTVSSDFRTKQQQPRVLQSLRKGASAFKVSMPKIKDVNKIDMYSRVIFPVSFILFNICYWSFYIM